MGTLKSRHIKFIKSLILGMVLLFAFSRSASAQNVNYKSQSLYLYIFTKNIIWPENSPKGDFKIGVYGNSPILNELKVMASLKKAPNGQKIVVEQIASPDDLDEEHILYIASSKSRELKNIVAKIANRPMLVVAERDGLARKGACINFIVMENDNLKFEVNKTVLESHNLRISDQLLKRGFLVN